MVAIYQRCNNCPCFHLGCETRAGRETGVRGFMATRDCNHCLEAPIEDTVEGDVKHFLLFWRGESVSLLRGGTRKTERKSLIVWRSWRHTAKTHAAKCIFFTLLVSDILHLHQVQSALQMIRFATSWRLTAWVQKFCLVCSNHRMSLAMTSTWRCSADAQCHHTNSHSCAARREIVGAPDSCDTQLIAIKRIIAWPRPRLCGIMV